MLTFEDKYDEESRYCAPCSIHDLLHNPSSTIIDACHSFKYDYTVLGVCNGLVCLLDSYLGDGFVEYWVRFWNPATRFMSQDSPRILGGRHSSKFGFGYDDWSDTYQVVLLDYKSQSQKMEVRVHCLGGTGWRNILTCPSFPTLSRHGASVSGTVNWLALPNLKSSYQRENVTINESTFPAFPILSLHGASVSGTVNWLALPNLSSDHPCTMKDLVIFSYDLKNETYRYLSMPNSLLEVPPPYPSVLDVLKGCLCLSHHQRGGTRFDFWLMMEFGVQNSWTHLLNISYQQLHIHGHIHGFPAIPLILCMSEDDDVMLLAKGRRGKFILYNKRDSRIDRYGDFHKGRCQFLSYDYVQSLVMPYRN